MTTPTPEEQAGEAFAASAARVVQATATSFKLVMAIADAVRRQRQKKAGREGELRPAEKAAPEASEEVKKFTPPDISAVLMSDADWQRLAQQHTALRNAGVDLEAMVPRVGGITVTVRGAVAANIKITVTAGDAVAANTERVARGSTETSTKMLRETMAAGPVREAILSSPAWPEMAALMADLDERGVDVGAVLAFAHEVGVGVDQAVAKAAAAEMPTTSRDALLSYGPLTNGLDIPKNLDLSDPERALRQLAIDPGENARFTRMVREAMPGMEREANLLVTSKPWPLVAARMADMGGSKQVADRLARLSKDVSWQEGPKAQMSGRLVQAASDALCKAVGGPATESRVKVNTTAARSQSPSVGSTKATRPEGVVPTQPGVAPHREAGPVAKGRAR